LGYFFAVNGANTDDILKETNKTVSPMLAAHSDKINLNPDLFQKIKTVYDSRESLNLDAVENYLLEETYKDFVSGGANLNDTDKDALKTINKRMAEISQMLNENLLNETNAFELHVDSKKGIEALPEGLLAGAAEEAKRRGHEGGWSFTLHRPSINPFLQSATDRDMRKKMFDAYAMRGDNDNENDNKALMEEQTNLRLQKANLLGYQSFADYNLTKSMAQTPAKVYELMDQLWKPALAMAKRDRDSFAKMLKADGIDDKFHGSDWRYYVAKERKAKYNFDEEETRPYFEFTAVQEGVFQLAKKLFGLTFKPMPDAPKWHEEQQVFEVLEKDGKHLGVIYMDFFTRESKRGGAWMNELRAQSNYGKFVTPIVTNNFNFPPPTADLPSLLSFSEAQTFFHEFGHALHGLFSNVKYESMSGTNVPRDFVEFPSQVMENWMSEPEVLKLYAKHYKTGEVIPDAMIKKMNEANGFDEGFRQVEYMAAAYLDMNWHSITKKNSTGAREFEKAAMDKIGLIEEIVPRYRTTYYGHIFGDGYAAGYYSYLWSQVLDADTFNEFKKTGNVFDPTLAAKFREMLASGGSKTGEALYKDFMGRDPEIQPLVNKLGFN